MRDEISGLVFLQFVTVCSFSTILEDEELLGVGVWSIKCHTPRGRRGEKGFVFFCCFNFSFVNSLFYKYYLLFFMVIDSKDAAEFWYDNFLFHFVPDLG